MFDDVCDCGYEDTNDGIEFLDPSHDKDSHSVIMRLAVLHTRSGEESSDTEPCTGHCTVMRIWGSTYPHISTTLTRVFLSLLNKVWRVESQFSLLVLFLCFNMLQQLGVFSQFREILTVVANSATDGAAAVRAVPQFFFNYYNERRRRRDIRQLATCRQHSCWPSLHCSQTLHWKAEVSMIKLIFCLTSK